MMKNYFKKSNNYVSAQISSSKKHDTDSRCDINSDWGVNTWDWRGETCCLSYDTKVDLVIFVILQMRRLTGFKPVRRIWFLVFKNAE